MLNTLEISVLNNRLDFHKEKRAGLLRIKKSQRGNELQYVDKAISTIKKWLK